MRAHAGMELRHFAPRLEHIGADLVFLVEFYLFFYFFNHNDLI